jgi:pyruvate formate lyase activating enzyme
MIKMLLQKGLVDHFAMDIKGPFSKYEVVTRTNVEISDIAESIALITGSGISHEFRTTLVSSLLKKADILAIADIIPYAQKYVLQKFIPSKHLDENFWEERSFSDGEISELKAELEKRLSCIMSR